MFQRGCFEAAGKSGFWKPCLGRTLQHLICHKVSTQLIWVQWECWTNILQHDFLFLFVRPWRTKVAELPCNLQLERLHLSWPRSLKPSTAHKENSAAVWWQDDPCFHQFHPLPMDWIWSFANKAQRCSWWPQHNGTVCCASLEMGHQCMKAPLLIKVQLLHQAQARHWVIKSFENQTLITMSLPDRCQAGETGSTDLPGTWHEEICRCSVDVLHSGKAKHPLLGLTKRTELHSIELSFSV